MLIINEGKISEISRILQNAIKYGIQDRPSACSYKALRLSTRASKGILHTKRNIFLLVII